MEEINFAANQLLIISLQLVAIPIAMATGIGLLIGLIQTITQLQEQTLSFGVKLFAILIVLMMMGPWFASVISSFSVLMIDMALI